MQTRWEYLTPPEFKRLAREEQICVLPIGSLERHGEHAPFGTDALIAHKVAVMASELEPCVVFPPYWFGQVHEAACFAGAINFPGALLYQMLETLLDQIAHNGFKKIVILSGHGGNGDFLNFFAMSQLDRRVDYTLYILKWGGPNQDALPADLYETKGGHAAENETSAAWAASAPDAVKLSQQCYPEPILPKTSLDHIEGVHTALWWYAAYPENVTESPSHASIEKGLAALEAQAKDTAQRLRAIKDDQVVPGLQREFYARKDAVKDNV